MAKESKIEWTHATFNPWIGCTKVSPGCEHCYAEAQDKRWGHQRWGPKAPRTRTSKAYWAQPLKWNAEAAKSGQQFRVFCASLADVCEDRDDLLAHRADLMRLIEATPALTWLLLTKRPENFERFFGVRWTPGGWPKNVWAMATAVTQAEVDAKGVALTRVPAVVRGLSMEPLLGRVDLRRVMPLRWHCSGCGYRTNSDVGRCNGYCQDPSGRSCDAVACPACGKHHYWTGSMPAVHWVIVGGESGPGARPMHPLWAREIREQCLAAGVAYHFKQWGEYGSDRGTLDVPYTPVHSGIPMDEPAPMFKVGKHAAGRILDGRLWDEFPGQAVRA